MIEDTDAHWHDTDLIATVPVTARTITLAIMSHVACIVLGALLVVLAVVW